MRNFHMPPRALAYLATSAAIGLLALSAAVPMTAAAREVSIPFDPASFSDPTKINNPFFPLVPGQTYVYRATGKDGCEEVSFEVTSQTREVAGVMTRVIHDIAYEDPECNGTLTKVEDTFDWHAQDNAGNVWYFGEDTKNCNGNVCTQGPGSWEAGVKGARPGLFMLAAPQSGDRYHQEFAAGVAEDQALVIGTNVRVALAQPAKLSGGLAYQQFFEGCIKTKDFTALSPGLIEHKYYCSRKGSFAGGLVAVDELHGGTVRVELISVSGP
jgi:hypothetical protein